jgi:hypothetical protein
MPTLYLDRLCNIYIKIYLQIKCYSFVTWLNDYLLACCAIFKTRYLALRFSQQIHSDNLNLN